MSGGGLNKKPVRVVELDKEYESQDACARALGISAPGINACLRGRVETYKDMHFEYVNLNDMPN